VVLKGGKTSYGARAAKSHTAALAGDYAVFSSILREAGAVVAETPTEFVDIAKALSFMGHLEPRGRRVLVVTNAGGPGVLATDELSRRGLVLPQTPQDAVEELSRLLPPIVALGNPVDLTGQASDDDYQLVLEKLAGRSEFNSILVIAPVQPATMTIRVADIIADTVWRVKKPATVMTIGADYGELVKEYLDSRGIPAYPLPDRAAYSLWALIEASRPLCDIARPGNPPERAVELVEKALSEGRSKLLEHEALELLEHYGVPVAPYCLARTPEEASICAEKIASNRLVAKIVSPDIIHKSDVGGVLLGIDPERAREAYEKVIRRVRARVPDARIVGVLFQAEAPKGVEVIVGSRRDEGFGPIVVYGMGGILVELLRDFSIGLAPASKCRALEMIRETKSSKLLEGYRGSGRKDIESLAEAITRVSRITAEIDNVREVDVNPVMVYEEGVLAVDARVIIA
ncbi:MAG: acetate--CoA ligase family protein, partial [Desulfurococcales archaeon]|nr:acetate--CoA ligase family protein [Desulfurococcales archaeon]